VNSDEDLYGILGVEPDASEDEITTAYHRLVRRYHPDHNPDPAATGRFQAVQRAYEVLRDRGQRTEYDRRVVVSETSPPGPRFHIGLDLGVLGVSVRLGMPRRPPGVRKR